MQNFPVGKDSNEFECLVVVGGGCLVEGVVEGVGVGGVECQVEGAWWVRVWVWSLGWVRSLGSSKQ